MRYIRKKPAHSDKTILSIYKMLETGAKYREVAERFQVKLSFIFCLNNGGTYGHLFHQYKGRPKRKISIDKFDDIKAKRLAFETKHKSIVNEYNLLLKEYGILREQAAATLRQRAKAKNKNLKPVQE